MKLYETTIRSPAWIADKCIIRHGNIDVIDRVSEEVNEFSLVRLPVRIRCFHP